MKPKGAKDHKDTIRKPRVDIPMDEIVGKYVQGASCNELAKQYGVNPCTIKKRLLKLGLYEPNRVYSKPYKYKK